VSRLGTLTIAALSGAALAACARAPAGPPEPVAVHFGDDECAHCKMIVSDDRQAAEVVKPGGAATIYDDLGCLLTREAVARPDPGNVFVRAFDGSGWLRAEAAIVVRSREIASPMGYGYAAFAAGSAAETEARRHPDAAVVPLATLLRDGAPRPPALPVTDHATPVLQGEIQP
jgi:copper chaperone NosL